MRILLLSANRLVDPYPVYPIGLDYVRGALEPGHQVTVLDMAVDAHREALDDRVRALDPELVGVALRNIDNTEAQDARAFLADYQELVARLRRLTDAPLVLGGTAFTIAPEELLDALGADYGILGEGERLAELADVLAAGPSPEALDSVPGLLRPQSSPTPPAPLEGPPRRALAEPGPQLDHYLGCSGMLNLQTQRGCPFRCVYCTYPMVEGRRMRPFDPEEVARQARRLQDLGARFLFVTDSVFNADEEHGLAVAHAFKKAGLSIPWGGYFSPRTTDRAYWQGLAEGGLSHVEFGTDGLDDRVLTAYRKPFDRDRAVAAHEAALAADLAVAHFFALGGPGETPETLESTFDTARRLERTACFYFAGVRVFPGTELAAQVPHAFDGVDSVLEPTFYEPPGWSLAALLEQAEAAISAHPGWILGSGGARLAKALRRLYALGYTGPLWERLIL